MIISGLNDLQVYQQALKLADEISAILDRSRLQEFPVLRDQLANASAAVAPRISEGYAQSTDRHCAHFQRLARGSANEMLAHLAAARARNCITADECKHWVDEYTIVGKRLTRWIARLINEDRRDRH